MLILPMSLVLILNSVCFLKISHRKRVLVMMCLNGIACVVYGMRLAYSAIFSGFEPTEKYAFYICLGASLITGICQALGEGVMISFIKKFDSRCIAGWSSGTGLAGLLGSGAYLLLRSLNVPLQIVND